MAEESFIDTEKVAQLNDKVYERGVVDREHLLEFLTCIDTNDQQAIVTAVKNWLQSLQDDPKYDKITFPKNDINLILGDLASYGRVQPETVMKFRENSDRDLT